MRNKTKTELIEICKVNNITGYSKFNKEDLEKYVRCELAEQEHDMQMQIMLKKSDNIFNKRMMSLKIYKKLEETKNLNTGIKEFNIGGTVFEGTFVRKGYNKHRDNPKMILLVNIINVETGKEVMDLQWFTQKPCMEVDLVKGCKVRFIARTNKEKRTVRGDSRIRYAYNDYRLAEVKDFVKV